MGKRCYVCKKKCTGDILKAEGEKFIHISCFKCAKCSRSLRETGYFTGESGEFLCAEDYRAISEQQSQIQALSPSKDEQPQQREGEQKVLSLNNQQQSINNNEATFSISPDAQIQQQPLADAPSSPTSPPRSPGSPTVCAACDQPLQSGQVLLALGEQWHVWCFKCSECAAVLQGEYMAHEGKPLCIRDYNLKYGVKCYECDKFIAGKVLQAGGYKFHPTCARCSRCGEHFGDGEEMYMQGDEIWHPRCEHTRTTENLAPSPGGRSSSLRARRAADEPKYHTHFGQHLTYMYLLPEAEQTYLKHPIAPHPPQPAQFHTPQGPIKIRKSRMSMLKTGMQRLTEDLERNTPRAKSPHMDNEEPIEMAHYPGGHAPDPSVLPPIEREDFPAPPYPYAVEELKRRLSSSSVENAEDDDESDEDYEDNAKLDEEKLKRAVEQLDTYDKDSSIAHVIKQNLEEAHKKQRLPLHWDPRNASRTPSAKKMSHLRFRYDTPINASPSRHLNRPKPWIYWQGAAGGDKAATTTIPFFHIPQRAGMCGRAATLPDGYHYGQVTAGDLSTMDGHLDSTLTSHFSDQSLNGTAEIMVGGGGTLPGIGAVIPGTGGGGGTISTAGLLRSSLPDMSKPAKIYALNELQTSNKKLPEDVDREHLERHLNRAEFEQIFSMSPIEFYKLPEWKRINLKRKAKLF
ncbi:unnamed protein product [Anisakis simplex]|uniref:Actin-binding lim zn-finger protein limatin involved in axon guidance n=1 Tax=Anisakis simplex TaxID=6269 RepID=A0A0M3JTR8_ANISI|nr:unnamed protein product [Anisakis simplex]